MELRPNALVVVTAKSGCFTRFFFMTHCSKSAKKLVLV